MKIIKYTTENLVCYRCLDKLGQKHHQIFEKEKMEMPIAIYINKNSMKLSNDFPNPEREYKYFDEMCEIVQALVQAECEDKFFEK